MDDLFSNVESKLKIYAKVIFICGIITGISCLLASGVFGFEVFLLIGIPACLVCIIVSLISACFVYAFAELVENTKEINHTLKAERGQIVEKKPIQKVEKREEQREAGESEKLYRISRSRYWDGHFEELADLAEKRAAAIKRLSSAHELTTEEKKQLQDLIQAIDDELNKDRF